MTKMKILGTDSDFNVTIKIEDLLLTYKQYKRKGLNLLVGRNSTGLNNIDIFDVSTMTKNDDDTVNIELVTPIEIDDYLFLNDDDDKVTLQFLVEFTWLNKSKPKDRYLKDPDGNYKYNIDHLDGNKKNNSLENLELVTREVNLVRAYGNGYSSAPEYISELLTAARTFSKERYNELIDNMTAEFLKYKK